MKGLEKFLSVLMDRLSDQLAGKKGLLPLGGTVFVLLNFFFEIFFPGLYITQIDLFLHLGVIIAIFGLVLARAL